MDYSEGLFLMNGENEISYKNLATDTVTSFADNQFHQMVSFVPTNKMRCCASKNSGTGIWDLETKQQMSYYRTGKPLCFDHHPVVPAFISSTSKVILLYSSGRKWHIILQALNQNRYRWFH
jgi:hypothetical protein